MGAVTSLDDTVRSTARLHHPDLYLSALLAPRAARGDLIVLAAYLGEVRRIPLTVREPGLGLIRLQWWRDLIEAGSATGGTGAPVADAFLAFLSGCGLGSDDVLAPLDAAEVMFSESPVSDDGFESLLNGVGVVPFRLAAAVLGDACGGRRDDPLARAGQAYAAVLLAHDLPYHALMGRWPVPGDFLHDAEDPNASEAAARDAAHAATAALLRLGEARLTEMRRRHTEITPAARRAALPVALFGPYSQALQRPGRDPLRDISGISPLRRVLCLWRAHLRSKL